MAIDRTRRVALGTTGRLTLLGLFAAAGWVRPGEAIAEPWNKLAFDGKTVADALRALGAGTPNRSRDITFPGTPDIAEDGAQVPIGVASAIPRTSSIAILVENNPNALAAIFDFPPGTEPAVSIRLKMAQSAAVYALVRADGKFHVAMKEVRITIGGCG